MEKIDRVVFTATINIFASNFDIAVSKRAEDVNYAFGIRMKTMAKRLIGRSLFYGRLEAVKKPLLCRVGGRIVRVFVLSNRSIIDF